MKINHVERNAIIGAVTMIIINEAIPEKQHALIAGIEGAIIGAIITKPKIMLEIIKKTRWKNH